MRIKLLMSCSILLHVSSVSVIKGSEVASSETTRLYRHDEEAKEGGTCLDYSDVCTSDADCCDHLYLACNTEQGRCRCITDYVYNYETLVCYYQISATEIIIIVACSISIVLIVGGSILFFKYLRKRGCWGKSKNGSNSDANNEVEATRLRSTAQPNQPLPPIGFDSFIASNSNMMPVIPQSLSPTSVPGLPSAPALQCTTPHDAAITEKEKY